MNQRPLGPKPSALPTELHPDIHFFGFCRCGQTCGQRLMFEQFAGKRKRRNPSIYKVSRDFEFPVSPGVLHAPKPRTLPTELHPEIIGAGRLAHQFILSQKHCIVKHTPRAIFSVRAPFRKLPPQHARCGDLSSRAADRCASRTPVHPRSGGQASIVVFYNCYILLLKILTYNNKCDILD